MRDLCPLCADTGAVLMADGGIDACGRCTRVAEAEHRFARLTRAPAPTAAPGAQRRDRRLPFPRPLPRRAGAISQPEQVTA
ncbi:hypothetical protein [Falsiroseomonas sp.]|uniref:hypothetical protein n=1 Tax=Falsiroseomonas sp. TaxID=2870721 RepID=UPI003F70210D